MSGGEAARGRHRIWSSLQALSCQHRAWHRARTHGPWEHDLSRSRMLNQLSHPGVPRRFPSLWGPNNSFLLLIPLPLEMCQARNCCGWSQRGCCLFSPVGFWWFLVSHLGLSSILNLFLCMAKKLSSFILLHVAVEVSQYHLLTRLFLLDILSCFVEDYLTIWL